MLGRIHRHARSRLNFGGETSKSKRLALYKRFLKLETEMMHRRHRAGESGLRIVNLRSQIIDVLLEHLFNTALENFQQEKNGAALPSHVAMIALGGYGRAELSPLSDIDFMFLFPTSAKGPEVKDFQEYLTNEILYPLWDLNLKVGHSTRTITEAIEAAREDIQTKTALLEARIIGGSQSLFEIFQQAYKNFYQKEKPRAYLEMRLSDQTTRRQKYGDTVFLQEPDIKNGVGGLRDYQNTLWMARIKLAIDRVDDLCEHNYLGKNEQKEFLRAYDFLTRVRNDLHFTLKRPSDLLDLEKQPIVAQHLGYDQKDLFERVEVFMRDYYRHAQTIYRYSKLLEKRLALRPASGEIGRLTFRDVIAARKMERQKKFDGFILRGSELSFASPKVFREERERLIRVFRYCQQFKCIPDFELESLIQESLPLITRKVINSPRANATFRSILEEPGMVYPILSQMHELGVLGRFVPEFGRLTCLVQHEYYHRYTADVHTLSTIRELDNIYIVKEPPMEKYREILHELNHSTILYLILFLHDIGKAFGIAGHAKAGADIAPAILQRLQVPKKNWDLILFIVENHLMMARFWQKHDIDDSDTIASFAEQVQDFEKLGFLYVHTFCDARGTAAGLWNSYKDSLHRKLFKGTFEKLTYGDRLERQNAEKKEMTLTEIKARKIPGITHEEIDAHYSQLPDRYFLQTESDEIVLHIQMVHNLLANIALTDSIGSLIPVIDWNDDLDRGLTVVNVVTWDRVGLFSKLAGAFARAGLNILSAKAISRADHIAIDTFSVVEPNRGTVKSEASKSLFEKVLKDALLSDKDLMPEIEASAGKNAPTAWGREDELLRAPIQQKLKVYHELSLNRTVVEVQANDRIGLLYRLSRIIFDCGYSISFARIATERGVAIDTFYIELRADNDEPVSEEPQLIELEKELAALIAPPPTPASDAPAGSTSP
jgi:[protein-PII] uridylyltransferase